MYPRAAAVIEHQGMKSKYFARVCSVEVPGNRRSPYASRTCPKPRASWVSGWSNSRIISRTRRSSSVEWSNQAMKDTGLLGGGVRWF